MVFDLPELIACSLRVYKDTHQILFGLFEAAVHRNPTDRPDGVTGIASDDAVAIILGQMLACNETMAKGFQVMEQCGVDIKGVSAFLKKQSSGTTAATVPIIQRLAETAWRQPETPDPNTD